MNRYGQLILEHWQRHRPAELAGIEDQTSFFSTLGRETQRQVEELAERIAGEDRPGEEYLDKVGRLREARMTAESEVLRAMFDQQEPATRTGWPGSTEWLTGAPDPDDPVWQQDHAAQTAPTD